MPNITGNLIITRAGSFSLNEFNLWGFYHDLSDPAYGVYLGNLRIATIIKSGEIWATDVTERQQYKTLKHAISAIKRRIKGKVGWKYEEVNV